VGNQKQRYGHRWKSYQTQIENNCLDLFNKGNDGMSPLNQRDEEM